MAFKLKSIVVIMSLVLMIFVGMISVSATTFEWNELYGGTGNDKFFSTIQTSDGNYLSVGFTYSNDGDVPATNPNADNCEAYIVKSDPAGNIIWVDSFGGWARDAYFDVIETSRNTYLAAGEIDINNEPTAPQAPGNWRPGLIEYDSNGNIISEVYYGSSAGEFTSVIETSDGGYVAVGDQNIGGYPHGLIVKYDSAFNVEWSNTQDLLETTYNDVIQTSDGGYAVAGGGYSNYTTSSMVAKYDSLGNLEWETTVYGNAFHDLVEDDLGNIYAVGRYDLNGSVAKFDSTGTKIYNSYVPTSTTDENKGIVIDEQGNLVVTGTSSDDVYVRTLDTDGNLISEDVYGGTGEDEASSIVPTTDGGYIISGSSQSSQSGTITDVNNGATDGMLIKVLP